MATKKKAATKTAKPLAPYKSKKQFHVLLTEAEMKKVVRLAAKHETTGTGVIRLLLEKAS